MSPPLTLDTLGQSQSPLNIPANGCEAVLELLVTVVLLTATGVVAAIVLVTTFGHGWDTYVKLELKQTGLILVIIILIAQQGSTKDVTTNQRLQRECVNYLLLKSDLLYNKINICYKNLFFSRCVQRQCSI